MTFLKENTENKQITKSMKIQSWILENLSQHQFKHLKKKGYTVRLDKTFKKTFRVFGVESEFL